MVPCGASLLDTRKLVNLAEHVHTNIVSHSTDGFPTRTAPINAISGMVRVFVFISLFWNCPPVCEGRMRCLARFFPLIGFACGVRWIRRGLLARWCVYGDTPLHRAWALGFDDFATASEPFRFLNSRQQA